MLALNTVYLLLVITPNLLTYVICHDKQSVCYDDIGCFHSVEFMLPDTKDYIGTLFTMYSRTPSINGTILDYTQNTTIPKFVCAKKLVVMMSGWKGGATSPEYINLREDFIQKFDVNVLIVAWERGASRGFFQAAINGQVVGRQTAKMIQAMHERCGLDMKKVHMVCVSLGGHICGFTGKWIKHIMNDTIGRISGLDPSGFGFQMLKPEFHLVKEDADFVDVIHTSAGKIPIVGDVGILQGCGHVDFYVNGGRIQPHCSSLRSVFTFVKYMRCIHLAAMEFYQESLSEKCLFTSTPCVNISNPFISSDYWTKNCVVSCEKNNNRCGRMGYFSDIAPGRGPQFLTTHNTKPFCVA